MIHVCSLALLHETVARTGASHLVTLLRNTAQAKRPATVAEQDHLVLSLDDIVMQVDGYVAPGEDHVTRLVAFARQWDRTAPMVIHCFAGISRSTAGAFITACAIDPERKESDIAWALRRASPTASPNARLVALADAALGRDGRMIAAIDAIGPGELATTAEPFELPLTR